MLKKEFFILLVGGLLYFFLAKFGMSFFSIQLQHISLIWLPFGIGVILVQKYGLKASFIIFLASFLAHFSFTTDVEIVAFIHRVVPSLADAFAPVLSVYLIRKYLKVELKSISELLPFTFWGGIVPTFISSIVITLNWFIAGDIHNGEILNFIVLLTFSDTMGFILLYPMYKYFDEEKMTQEEKYIILKDILVGIGIVISSMHYQFLIFLLYPLLLLSAYRLRIKYLMVVLSVIIIISMMILNAFEIHLFSDAEPMDSILMVGSFFSTLIFIIIGISLHNSELEHTKYLTRTDNLTKMLNRKAYKEKIHELLLNFNRYNQYFSIILLDVDSFKNINDTLGHPEGDKVLIELSTLIKNNLRENDYSYRIGGEEFIVLLPYTNLEQAHIVAEKIRATIEDNLRCRDGRVVTVSIGLTQVKEKDSVHSIYSRVDEFQYFAKKYGKNQVYSS